MSGEYEELWMDEEEWGNRSRRKRVSFFCWGMYGFFGDEMSADAQCTRTAVAALGFCESLSSVVLYSCAERRSSLP